MAIPFFLSLSRQNVCRDRVMSHQRGKALLHVLDDSRMFLRKLFSLSGVLTQKNNDATKLCQIRQTDLIENLHCIWQSQNEFSWCMKGGFLVYEIFFQILFLNFQKDFCFQYCRLTQSSCKMSDKYRCYLIKLLKSLICILGNYETRTCNTNIKETFSLTKMTSQL